MSDTFGLQLALALLLTVADVVLSLPTGHGTVAGEIATMPGAELAFIISGAQEQPDADIPALLGP
jgi:hypothetical protein